MKSPRRLRSWPHWLVLRRLTAVALVLLAAALALRPSPERHLATVPMLVAARDLPPGTTLRGTDVAVTDVPPALRPAAALTTVAEVEGRVLAGATTTGEPLTGARLVGRESSHLSTGDPSAAAVPFRLADPAVAVLLTPGMRVDVVTVSPDTPTPLVLASNAPVLTVRSPQEDASLVVIAVPREEAAQVAAAALAHPVAVTLR